MGLGRVSGYIERPDLSSKARTISRDRLLERL